MKDDTRQFIYKLDRLGKMERRGNSYLHELQRLQRYIERRYLPDAIDGERFVVVDGDSGEVLGQWLVHEPKPTKQLVTLPEWEVRS